ncbi:MAG: phosphatase PAP2 family protein, partial [Thermoleophilia bacterium]|nr:phosphatase PAP2 family protein [Thermoleophilia bacterium]
MQLAPVNSARSAQRVDVESTSARGFATDAVLVPGLTLPVVSGLPDASTDGWSLDYLKGPPAAGSAAATADLAVVQAAQLLRTPEGDAWAVHLAHDGAFRMWIDLARREHGLTGAVQSWLGTALIASTLAANAAVTQIVKHRFQRPRPFQVDPSIKPPVKLPRDTSYPSGHTSSAFAAARIVSVLRPQLAGEAYNLATQVAVSRVYAGVHFPSDVRAGAQLGTQVAQL